MKASELRELGLDELKDKASELNEELFNLQFQHATGQLENPMRLRQIRKDIARANTVLRQMQLAGAEE